MSDNGSRAVGVLTLVFVALKVTGVVDWSWWWVMSPALLHIGLVVCFVVVFALVALIGSGRHPK